MKTTDDLAHPQTHPAEADPPYPPSWIDRFTAWLERLPFPLWLCYLGLWLALFLPYSGVKWWDGAYPLGTFNLVHLLLTGTSVYGLALMHYLDRSAERALATFRPVLTVNAKDYTELQYRLTTLPAQPTLWMSLLIGLWRGPSFLYHQELFASLKLGTSPLALGLEIFFLCFLWAVAGAFSYHTFHQLRLVRQIYTHCTRINLFQQGPLYAFSQLTARTALGVLLLNGVWAIAETATGQPLVLLETTLFFTLVALITFVWPLHSVHAVLVAEKQRRQDETTHRLATTFVELERRVDAGDWEAISALQTAIDSLRTKQEVVAKRSTWPWQVDTVRGVVAAAPVPLIIWVIQRLLDHYFFTR